ncbi:uncharacterized protein [Eurosta solidaginis]
MVIACPHGTSISIEFAQYTKFGYKDEYNIDKLCSLDKYSKRLQTNPQHFIRGSPSDSPSSKTRSSQYVAEDLSNRTIQYSEQPTISSNTNGVADAKIDEKPIHWKNSSNIISMLNASSEDCMWPNALQYSLLQTVVEACQKKKHCKFQGASHDYRFPDHNATVVNTDSCNNRRKVVEVAYKCRPYEFRSKVACHNDIAQLECNPYSRIAVYSAKFGRTEYESIQCPQPQGVREETCQASYTTETVMQICHGRRRCNLAADANTFGSPCQPNSRMYLKVVYTCVPKQVLKDRYQSEIEGDETNELEGEIEVYENELNYEAIPKIYNNSTLIEITTPSGNSTTVGILNSNNASISFHLDVPDSIDAASTHSVDLNLEDDQERLYLCLLMVVSGGIVVCIIAVSVHILFQRHESVISEQQVSPHRNSSTNICVNTTISNLCNETMSQIGAEINTPNIISMASKAKSENYLVYGLNNGYIHCEGSNRVRNSASIAMQGNSSISSTEIVVRSVSSNIITNSKPSSVGISPDVIGISKKTCIPVTATDAMSGNKMHINRPTINSGTGFLMALQAQFIPPSATHISYTSNSPGFLQVTPNTIERNQLSVISSSSYVKPSALHPKLQTHQLSYEGTETHTLPMGINTKSQFYYG